MQFERNGGEYWEEIADKRDSTTAEIMAFH